MPVSRPAPRKSRPIAKVRSSFRSTHSFRVWRAYEIPVTTPWRNRAIPEQGSPMNHRTNWKSALQYRVKLTKVSKIRAIRKSPIHCRSVRTCNLFSDDHTMAKGARLRIIVRRDQLLRQAPHLRDHGSTVTLQLLCAKATVRMDAASSRVSSGFLRFSEAQQVCRRRRLSRSATRNWRSSPACRA